MDPSAHPGRYAWHVDGDLFEIDAALCRSIQLWVGAVAILQLICFACECCVLPEQASPRPLGLLLVGPLSTNKEDA